MKKITQKDKAVLIEKTINYYFDPSPAMKAAKELWLKGITEKDFIKLNPCINDTWLINTRNAIRDIERNQ